MGINIILFRYIQMIVDSLDRELTSSRICLLGNLYFGQGTQRIQKQAGTKIVHKYFEKRGIDVVSIDLNGKDGALSLDLQEPLPASIGTFDIIINGGTTEHVGRQYECFKNIHNICRIDGLMFHQVPEVGSWLRHGLYHYNEAFFKDLAKSARYSEVEIHIDDYVGPKKKLVFACLRKEYDAPFIQQEMISWPKD